MVYKKYMFSNAVFPPSYYFPTDETVSVNGSSAVGQCSDVTTGIGNGTLSRCNTPTTSVLFDGNIPTLTGLDGNMWASQLLTIRAVNAHYTTIFFNTDNRFLGRVELVMFNCPEQGVFLSTIRVLTASSPSATASVLGSFNPTITSCDSLVRVCFSLNTNQAVLLQLFPFPGFNWVHLAEVTFIGISSKCPPDTTIAPPHTTAPPPDTTTPPPPDTTTTPPIPDTTTPSIPGIPPPVPLYTSTRLASSQSLFAVTEPVVVDL
jgi:hypothetical protein